MGDENKEEIYKPELTKFTINSYWIDFQAHPNHPNVTPTIIVSEGTDRTHTPYAIIYFHYEVDFPHKSGVDHERQIIYLHYHISSYQPILDLLKSEQPLDCYIKPKPKDWGGINLHNTIQRKTIHG